MSDDGFSGWLVGVLYIMQQVSAGAATFGAHDMNCKGYNESLCVLKRMRTHGYYIKNIYKHTHNYVEEENYDKGAF